MRKITKDIQKITRTSNITDNGDKTMYKFRVHHIMCTNLYQGYGYSGAFCENMTRMVQWLNNNPNEPLMLITNADDICASCPNLVDNKYCEDENNHVHLKDSELLLALQLEEGMTYTYSYLKSQAKIFLSKEIFEKSCSNCKWYKQGLCRYEDFKF